MLVNILSHPFGLMHIHSYVFKVLEFLVSVSGVQAQALLKNSTSTGQSKEARLSRVRLIYDCNLAW